MKVGIFFGSTTGTTEGVAERIAEHFDGAEVTPVADADFSELADLDLVILGSSTWGVGDLQEDWEDRIDDLSEVDLSGKSVALFGAGDQEGYPDSFVDSIGILAEAVEGAGAKIVGQIENSGYSFDESKAVRDGKLLGLPIDEDNESDLTDERIANWVKQVKADLA